MREVARLFFLDSVLCYYFFMPTLDELDRITRFTQSLQPEIADAMRVIFLLTERDNEYMGDYIAVAVGLQTELSPVVRNVLKPYHLFDESDGIPDGISQAVRQAVDQRYLEVREHHHQIRCSVCGGPHQTDKHGDWSSPLACTSIDDITKDLKFYKSVIDAFKEGGMVAAEGAICDMGLKMNHDICFCGSSDHSGEAHLRLLLDEQSDR